MHNIGIILNVIKFVMKNKTSHLFYRFYKEQK